MSILYTSQTKITNSGKLQKVIHALSDTRCIVFSKAVQQIHDDSK